MAPATSCCLNTGTELVRSKHGLLTTVCYQFGGAPAVYALGGAIAVTGSAVQWLRDQLGIISSASEIEILAGQVEDSGACTSCRHSRACSPLTGEAMPAGRSSGCPGSTPTPIWRGPRWSRSVTRVRDVVEAMEQDCGVHLEVLKVDGGVTANNLCMQLQADILGVPVSRPVVAETTALGAAYAAGLAVGFWSGTDELRANWAQSRRWQPSWDERRRTEGLRALEEGRRADAGLGRHRLTRQVPFGQADEPGGALVNF